MSEHVKISRFTPSSLVFLVFLGVLICVLASGPAWLGRANMRLIVDICAYLTLAQMWNLLAGYAGMVSIGQQAYVGVGGYVFFALAAFAGIDPLLALPAAGILAGLIAIPAASIAFRLHGAYFAVGTWVIAEILRLSFAQIQLFGGGSGMSLPIEVVRSIADGRDAREAIIYWIALAMGVGAIAMVYGLIRSRYGLALMAVRDNEQAALSAGVNIRGAKYLVFVLAAIMTGLAGALIFLSKLRISPDAAFSVTDWTAYVIFIVVIGGVGRIEGPIIGTLAFFLLRGLLADLGAVYLIILGALAVIVTLVSPRGLWGFAADRLDLFPTRRHVHVVAEDS